MPRCYQVTTNWHPGFYLANRLGQLGSDAEKLDKSNIDWLKVWRKGFVVSAGEQWTGTYRNVLAWYCVAMFFLHKHNASCACLTDWGEKFTDGPDGWFNLFPEIEGSQMWWGNLGFQPISLVALCFDIMCPRIGRNWIVHPYLKDPSLFRSLDWKWFLLCSLWGSFRIPKWLHISGWWIMT